MRPPQENTSYTWHTLGLRVPTPAAQLWRRILGAVCVTAVSCSLAACGDNIPSQALHETMWEPGAGAVQLSGEFAGAGASSQKSAVDAWIVGYTASQDDIAISYDPSGSGAGVNTFLTGATAWAGTDAPLSKTQVEVSRNVCAADTAFDVPVYVSPIAVAYNLSDYGIDESEHVQLSAQTLADIFNGRIRWWDDDRIVSENPKLASRLPHIEITPVWRSDKSGTTKTFQTYLHRNASQNWTSMPSETWPNSVGQGAKGTPGVVMTISQAQGTIGYADAAQTAGLGTVAVKVGDVHALPRPDATARLIEKSKVATQDSGKGSNGAVQRFVIDVDYATSEKDVYPIALVSYAVVCHTYHSERTAQFVKQWLTYVLSEKGQKTSQDNAGSAPIPLKLREQISPVIETISSAQQSSASAVFSKASSTTLGGNK